MDSISDLVESQSRLLEALQLSHPNELDIKKATGRTQAKLSLNPIYRQVPRVLERCCSYIEAYGEPHPQGSCSTQNKRARAIFKMVAGRPIYYGILRLLSNGLEWVWIASMGQVGRLTPSWVCLCMCLPSTVCVFVCHPLTLALPPLRAADCGDLSRWKLKEES